MPTRLQVQSEDEPGPAWTAAFEQHWPAYERWFLREGAAERPTYLQCERALRRYMPEMFDLWKRLVELAGGGDRAARFLSMYCPPPYLTGCSQAVWGDDAHALLVRNYDYLPELWEASGWRTQWQGRGVLGVSDCLWGLLDGVNDAGLCVSLAFGGRRTVGPGFGIPLILRCVLQSCETVAEGVAVLARVPSNMSYNVTLLDRHGTFETVYLSPDRPLRETQHRVATNHQGAVDWPQHAEATGSVDRLRILTTHVNDPDETTARFLRRFLEPPVYKEPTPGAWGTLYTAVYSPSARSLVLLWPDATATYTVGADA